MPDAARHNGIHWQSARTPYTHQITKQISYKGCLVPGDKLKFKRSRRRGLLTPLQRHSSNPFPNHAHMYKIMNTYDIMNIALLHVRKGRGRVAENLCVQHNMCTPTPQNMWCCGGYWCGCVQLCLYTRKKWPTIVHVTLMMTRTRADTRSWTL